MPKYSHRKSDPLVILGAGPAGLTAALEALRQGFKNVTVLERDSQVGGLARTVRYKGNRFDIGGHRFFSKSAWVNAWWREILKDDFLRVKRLSRIYYRGRFFNYPLEPFNVLRQLGLVEALRILGSYFAVRAKPLEREDTFEQWVVNRFGWRLYTTFFKSYTEKVWGVSTKELSSDWARQRIKDFSLGVAIKNALKLGSEQGPQQITKTLIQEFHYPKCGPGMMWEVVAQRIHTLGGRVLLNAPAVSIRAGSQNALEIITPAQPRALQAATVISSVPLRTLGEIVTPAPPPAVKHALEALRYRDFLTVVVVVKRKHVFPDQWIYVHDPLVRVGRVQNFKNWSPAMVANPAQTLLGLEYFVSHTDELWGWTDEALIELATQELARIALVRENEVQEGTVARVRDAYPIYDQGYQAHLGVIRAWLKRAFPALVQIGRNGLHRYNNQDHSMLTAKAAIDSLQGGVADPWTVADGDEYFEAQA